MCSGKLPLNLRILGRNDQRPRAPPRRYSGESLRARGPPIGRVFAHQENSCDRRKEPSEKKPRPRSSARRLRPICAEETEQIEDQTSRCVIVHCRTLVEVIGDSAIFAAGTRGRKGGR